MPKPHKKKQVESTITLDLAT